MAGGVGSFVESQIDMHAVGRCALYVDNRVAVLAAQGSSKFGAPDAFQGGVQRFFPAGACGRLSESIVISTTLSSLSALL